MDSGCLSPVGLCECFWPRNYGVLRRISLSGLSHLRPLLASTYWMPDSTLAQEVSLSATHPLAVWEILAMLRSLRRRFQKGRNQRSRGNNWRNKRRLLLECVEPRLLMTAGMTPDIGIIAPGTDRDIPLYEAVTVSPDAAPIVNQWQTVFYDPINRTESVLGPGADPIDDQQVLDAHLQEQGFEGMGHLLAHLESPQLFQNGYRNLVTGLSMLTPVESSAEFMAMTTAYRSPIRHPFPGEQWGGFRSRFPPVPRYSAQGR